MRLYLLELGIVPANDVGMTTGMPFPGYLIQTEDGTNVLVDTGFPPDMVDAPWPLAGGVVMRAEHLVANQLALLGIAPDAIDYLVCTHFDIDHAGAHDAFPRAELVVQRAHYDMAREHPRFQRTRPHWDAPHLRYRVVEGDTALLPGIALIETSGHVVGHQSVLVRLPRTGPVLLAIDAIPQAAQRDPENREVQRHDMDAPGVRASTRKLVELAEREGVALILFGHDAEQWKTLKHAPGFYD